MDLRRGSVAIIMTVCLMSFTPVKAFSQQQTEKLSVPKDTIFNLELLSPISTATNKKDDTFDCRVLSPAQFAGAIVSGRITKCKASGKVTGKSEIAMAFTSITLNGRTAKFPAQIKEVYEVKGARDKGRADPEGVITSPSLKKSDVIKVGAIGLAGWAISRIFLGPKAAAIIAAIAAGAAVATTLSTKGSNLVFADGTVLAVQTY